MLRESIPIIYGLGMAILIPCALMLGFVNGSNVAPWFIALFGGVGGLTLLTIIMEEIEDTDFLTPPRTYTSTSSKVVHIERPIHRFKRRFDDELD